MDNIDNKLKTNKEIKRHKSAIIPPGPILLNNYSFKDYFDSGINNTNSNSTTCDGLFRLKSNSLFAYQEFDKFSSFCDNESNNDQKNINNINNINEDIINKDDLNNTSSSYSLKELIEDCQINNKAKKRKSAFDSMPPQFSQCLNYPPNPEEMQPHHDQNNLLNNIINNHLSSDIRRTHTQKQNNNFINPFFTHFKNNQIQIPNLENRRRSQGFTPIYNYNLYNPNLNMMNNYQNIFYLNSNYAGGGLQDGVQVENLNDNNNNIINNIDIKDFPPIINEFPENFRKKSNSLALKTNPFFNQVNQIKTNNPYPGNNINLFSSSSKNNSKRQQRILSNNIFNNNYNILYIFQDQSKCRSIQEQLDLHKNDKKYLQNFFEQIKPELITLIEHQFGNYVIQKFLEIIIIQENKFLLNDFISVIDINDQLYRISINNYGTRVFQKTLEKIIDNNYCFKIETPELISSLKKLIEKHLYALCCDKNGNHVYQKLLKVFKKDDENSPKKNDFLYDSLSEIALNVALLQQGATIFNTAMDTSNLLQKEKICKNIVDNIEKLINDKYGNYTIQAIINKLENEKNLIEPIYLYMSDNILELSKQKCSSNVIDTFIMKKNEFSKKLVNDMIDKDIIKDVIKDQYGNYVVQKAMSISDNDTINKIVKQIKPIIPELLESNIGKKVYEKLLEQYNDLFNNEND
jgi:hypothetical protein